MPGVDEAAILSTCNRTEIMTVTGLESESRLLEWWRRERQAPEGYIEKFAYTHRDLGSITHSLRVAAGLDSMVVGEPQILGRSEEHTSELQSLMRITYAVFCLNKQHIPVIPYITHYIFHQPQTL